jgi:precorrin-6Y C5,15-methyltransferase (decarboxylating)
MIKESSNGVKVVSAHGRSADYSTLASEIMNNDRVAIFTDPVNTPARIAKEALERGVSDRRAFVCESIGTPKERVIEGTLKALSAKKAFAPLNVLILINDKTGAAVNRPVPGIPDEMFFHSAGMITKEELRVVSLSKLGLDRKSIVWDIAPARVRCHRGRSHGPIGHDMGDREGPQKANGHKEEQKEVQRQ